MTTAANPSAEESGIVSQYETLRGSALGGALPPEGRAGLLLFLRRGMWGWARAVATRSTFERPIGPRPPEWKAPAESRTVIHILAAMAIKTGCQGATP